MLSLDVSLRESFLAHELTPGTRRLIEELAEELVDQPTDLLPKGSSEPSGENHHEGWRMWERCSWRSHKAQHLHPFPLTSCFLLASSRDPHRRELSVFAAGCALPSVSMGDHSALKSGSASRLQRIPALADANLVGHRSVVGETCIISRQP